MVTKMKHKLEIFFDYACPYCLQGHRHLTELIPDYPEIDMVWHPCESHPRPDRFGPHSDLCIQGYFFAVENGVDIWAYHDRMYRAALKEHVNIESIDELSDFVRDLVDADAFRLALRQGIYHKALAEANKLAFEYSGIWVVPAYRMEGCRLDAVEDVGVTKEQLRSFLLQQATLSGKFQSHSK
jgi:predicted DsbA family dithiol-disulfide isomerase